MALPSELMTLHPAVHQELWVESPASGLREQGSSNRTEPQVLPGKPGLLTPYILAHFPLSPPPPFHCSHGNPYLPAPGKLLGVKVARQMVPSGKSCAQSGCPAFSPHLLCPKAKRTTHPRQANKDNNNSEKGVSPVTLPTEDLS